MGIVGTRLKAHITGFLTRADAGSAFATYPLRRTTIDAESNKNIRKVDTYVLDTGDIDIRLSAYIARDLTTGQQTLYSTRSGYFIDPAYWSLGYLQLPYAYRIENRGGGPRGAVESMVSLYCRGPQANYMVMVDADA